ENRSQGRWNGPAVDGGQQVPVPLNPWVIGDLQAEQQLAAVVGGVGLAERWGVAADQIGEDRAGLLGRWVDPGSSRRLDPFSDLVGQFVVPPRLVAGGPGGRLVCRAAPGAR